MADTPIAPPLPDGSVDFNAIHAAARQNHDLQKAVAEATFVHPDKQAAAEEAVKAAIADAIDDGALAGAGTSPATNTAKSGSKES